MDATLKLYGPLKTYTGGEAQISLPAGQTVRQALEAVGVPPILVALVVVNEEPQDKEYVLQAGDLVKVMAVLGGG